MIAKYPLVALARFQPLKTHEHGDANAGQLQNTQHELNGFVAECLPCDCQTMAQGA
jgi:hypothetical protein